MMKCSPAIRVLILSTFMTGCAFSARAQSTSVPDNLTNLTIDRSVIDTITNQLPESQAIGAEFLNEIYSPTLKLNEAAQIGVSFIHEGAGYRNSVGYFSFNDGAFDGLSFGDIDTDSSGNISAREIEALSGVNSVDILFANTSATGSGGSLQQGDTIVIGGGTISQSEMGLDISGGTVFDAGTNIGFFLSANAWNGGIDGEGSVAGWDDAGTAPPTYWTLDFLNPENVATATIDDVSRDTRHVAMLNVAETDQVIMGFEDLNRNSGDNDFNDAVFIVHSNPVGAFQGSDIPTVSAAPSPAVNAGLISVMIVGAGFAVRKRQKEN